MEGAKAGRVCVKAGKGTETEAWNGGNERKRVKSESWNDGVRRETLRNGE